SSTQHQGVTPDIELPSAIDASEFGESTEPSALPWDRIEAAASSADTKTLIYEPKLENLHQQRVATTESFNLLRQDIADFREATDRKTVSLQLEERRKELKEEQAHALKRENAWRATQGLPPVESLEAAAADEPATGDAANTDVATTNDASEHDVWLKESAQILVDLIKLNKTAEPALAASTDPTKAN
ncbi:MAG TPA: carboxy terminal-processing peptidase, partial [Gammaproteobacteria bacterium]|nr:carboxy terminal-processing peptidase [Gammaproteobacteria bacterium]